jgi:hypothetical protein
MNHEVNTYANEYTCDTYDIYGNSQVTLVLHVLDEVVELPIASAHLQ